MKKYIFFSILLCGIAILAACSGSKSAREDSLSPAELNSRLENKNTVLVDVRTPEEYAEGHLVNALLINYHDSSFQSSVLASVPKDAEVLLYCRSGNRSASAKEQMSRWGYSNVSHLAGGIKAWQSENFPVVK